MAQVTIDDELVDTITELAPQEVDGRKHFGDGLQSVVLQALMRKGLPDPQTGSLTRSYLIEGVLLRDTMEQPELGLEGDWSCGVVAVDVLGLMHVNDRLGMEGGEQMLKVVADGLRAFCPDRPIIRLHGDAFAALYLPPGGHNISDGSPDRLSDALTGMAQERMPELGEQGLEPRFTVAALDLVVERPFHWRVLGPLVWAEAERAHVAVRTGRASGLQHRRISLDGCVAPPAPPAPAQEPPASPQE